MPTRRQLLGMAPALLLPPALLAPRPLYAGPELSERKFLFIYAYGGWDTTMVFTPMQDNPNVDTEDDATLASANGIPFVDHAERPSVRQFFEDYGDRTCLINGIEVRSITHERCQKLLFTGGNGATEDWAVTLASQGQASYPVPHLVLTGPAFAAENLPSVVRTGESGQLVSLMDGSALGESDALVSMPSSSAESLEDALLAANIERFNKDARDGRLRMGQGYDEALRSLGTLEEMSGSVELIPEDAGCRRNIAADAGALLNAFEAGMSRCGLTQDDGWCSWTWDTHSNNILQVKHYEELFDYLNQILADLDGRTSLSGAPLADEVTIVVFSEMGRHPKLTGGGRAHWTYTSAMLIGGGVRGGQVIGGLDEGFQGQPVDLVSGEVHSSGTGMTPGNLGSTLLALADLDWEAFSPQTGPIEAAIS